MVARGYTDAKTQWRPAPASLETVMAAFKNLGPGWLEQIQFSRRGCWLWRGSVTDEGYGMAGRTRAHRLTYVTIVGPIPDDVVPDHLCRVRHCVNPEHLELVTSVENVLRGTGHSAMNKAKTHCKNGHEFTAENTYVWRDERGCIECRRQAGRRSRARRKEQGNG